jgi:chromatin assembly factor 1 subunit A
MTDSLQLPSFSPGIKRSHDGSPVTSGLELTPQTTHNSSTRDVSPAPSAPSSPLSELTATTPQRPQMVTQTLIGQVDPSISGPPPAKKPKLTFAERQSELMIQKLIKEEKAKVKADEKAKKEHDKQEEKRKKAEEKEAVKRQKEMEKAEKDAERAEKQKLKDEEKAKKEAEKVKKEEEKAKREEEKAAELRKKERVSLDAPYRSRGILCGHGHVLMLLAVANAVGSVLQSPSATVDSSYDARQDVGRAF